MSQLTATAYGQLKEKRKRIATTNDGEDVLCSNVYLPGSYDHAGRLKEEKLWQLLNALYAESHLTYLIQGGMTKRI